METIGRYRIDGVLGKGAMGVVYRAFDTGIQRAVAIKTIRKELLQDADKDNLLARFNREAVSAGGLNHPNIVTIYDFGWHGEDSYIVMELVEGRSLDSLLAAGQPHDPDLVVAWISQLLDALAFAHSHGIIHRDIKPANLVLSTAGQIKVTDFGIAYAAGAQLTQQGSMVGTPSYMAPEQILGDSIDGRVDVFSAAVIMFQLLTGKRPFEGTATTVMHAILSTPAPAPSSLHVGLAPDYDAVVLKGLARRTDARHASAHAFRTAIHQAHAAGAHRNGGAAASDDATVLQPVDGPAAAFQRQAPDPAARSSATRPERTTATRLDPGLLESVERTLVPFVGPMARILVKRSAAQSTNLDQLADLLERQIAGEAARCSFRSAIHALARRDASAADGTASAAVVATGPGSRAALDSSPAVATQTPASAAGTPDAIPPALVAVMEERLRVHLGAMARVVARRCAARASTTAEFQRLLSEHLPDEATRAAFRADTERP